MIRPIHLSLLAIAAIALGACGKKDTSSSDDADTPKRDTIGVTCITSSDPFSKIVEKNMKDEATKHGYQLIFLSCDNEVSKQQKQIKSFILQKVAAIAVSPADSRAIGTSVREANRNGVPVFSFSGRIESPEAEIIAHVGTDDRKGGELAGQAMIEALGETGGKVIIIDCRNVDAYLERVEGFKKAIDAHNAATAAGMIEIVAELPAGGDREEGFAAVEDALESHPGLDGIFAINDPSGLGAVGALEEADRLTEVTVVAFDGTPSGRQAIKDGDIFGAPIQHPDRIGRETIQAIIAHLSGEKVEPSIDIPATLYTKADADKDPDLK